MNSNGNRPQLRDLTRLRVARFPRALRVYAGENHLDIERIVAEFYAPVYRFAWALTANEIEAADLTQEAFLILCTQDGQIREPEKIKSWLFTTLRRAFLKALRARKARPEVALKPEHQARSTVHSTVSRSLDASAILDAFCEVDENYRAVLELFYLADLSYKETAAALQLPIGTVMSRLSRGKEQLRRILLKPHRSKKVFRRLDGRPVAVHDSD
jgi:RNA polymerase sigma-70 factor, ECF subfamily